MPMDNSLTASFAFILFWLNNTNCKTKVQRYDWWIRTESTNLLTMTLPKLLSLFDICQSLLACPISFYISFRLRRVILNNLSVFICWSTPASFLFIFVLFQTQILQKKIVDFTRIWTQIVGVEGEHDDHLTTTTAQINLSVYLSCAIFRSNFLFWYMSWPLIIAYFQITSAHIHILSLCAFNHHCITILLLQSWLYNYIATSILTIGLYYHFILRSSHLGSASF